MKTLRLYTFLMIMAVCSAGASAQTLQRGRELFAQGRFEAAKPIMLKYLKQQPENAARNYWYGACLYETGEKDLCMPYLEKAADKGIAKAWRYMGMWYDDNAAFDQAADSYEKFVAAIAADKDLHDQAMEERYTYIADSIRHMGRMVRNTQIICFLDSFKMAKPEFLDAYVLDPATGSLDTYKGAFGKSVEGDAFMPETGSSIYYSYPQQDAFRLFQAFKSGNAWTDAKAIEIPGTDGNCRWPFIENDGVTMYFASDGTNSIGGYDIFATRYNPATERWLVPENIGMPFNSEANDYMYVIDEATDLGWFATDRHQAEDSVCVYLFIPSETRQVYEFNDSTRQQVLSASKIESIAATQTDREAVADARLRYSMMLYGNSQKSVKASFLFVIDDMTDYHELSDFKSDDAREMYKKWQQMNEQYKSDNARLEELRKRYADADKKGREKLRQQILDLETIVEEEQESVKTGEINIRNTEIKYLTH